MLDCFSVFYSLNDSSFSIFSPPCLTPAGSLSFLSPVFISSVSLSLFVHSFIMFSFFLSSSPPLHLPPQSNVYPLIFQAGNWKCSPSFFHSLLLFCSVCLFVPVDTPSPPIFFFNFNLLCRWKTTSHPPLVKTLCYSSTRRSLWLKWKSHYEKKSCYFSTNM